MFAKGEFGKFCTQKIIPHDHEKESDGKNTTNL